MFITNRTLLDTGPSVRAALDLLEAGIAAAHPATLLPKAVRLDGDALLVGEQQFQLPPRGLVVVGGGKASGAMAQAFERVIGPVRIRAGVVATAAGEWPTARIRQIVAGHPVPDRHSRAAARAIVQLARGLTADDLVVCLLSGGGSAMLTDPAPGLTLGDLRRLTRLLLVSGAPIGAINVVRRHITRLSGGELARLLAPAQVLTLALRDVVNGPPEAIASGPTLPDGSTYDDALTVLDTYGIRSRLPAAVLGHLERGAHGGLADNPKPGDPAFERAVFREIGDPRYAVAGAVIEAQRRRYGDNRTLALDMQGEAREAARVLGAVLRQEVRFRVRRPRVLAWGGEFTVTMGKAKGEGGRCQEFMAALIPEIAGLDCAVAMAGTDGMDFVPGIAGAVITGETAARASTLGLDLDAALRDHATTPLHRALGTLIEMRPTGTNVCDLGICVIPPLPRVDDTF